MKKMKLHPCLKVTETVQEEQRLFVVSLNEQLNLSLISKTMKRKIKFSTTEPEAKITLGPERSPEAPRCLQTSLKLDV